MNTYYYISITFYIWSQLGLSLKHLWHSRETQSSQIWNKQLVLCMILTKKNIFLRADTKVKQSENFAGVFHDMTLFFSIYSDFREFLRYFSMECVKKVVWFNVTYNSRPSSNVISMQIFWQDVSCFRKSNGQTNPFKNSVFSVYEKILTYQLIDM